MRKRNLIIIPLLVLSLTGCSSSTNESDKTSSSDTVKATITSQDTESSMQKENSYLDKESFKNEYKAITLEDSPIYPSIFINNGTNIFFPNYDDNNRISFINKPIKEGTINTSQVTDFFDYSTYSLSNIGDYIFFSQADKDGILASIDVNNKSYRVINTEYKVNSLTAYDEKIFFINGDNNNLMSYDNVTRKFTLVCNDSIGKYLIDSNVILYQNKEDNNTLYSININGSDRQKLTDFGVDSFAPKDGKIIAINTSDDNNLYSINTSDLGVKRISVMYGENIKNVNDTLYFINVKNNRHLESINIEYDAANSAIVNFKDISKESINEYYVTDDNIFIQRSADVNAAYSIIKK